MNINSKKSISHNITFVACIALAGMCGLVYEQNLAYAQPSVVTSVPPERLTSDKMRAFATTAVEDIKSLARDVAKLTEQARKDSDAGLLECLTPHNVTMQTLVEVATGASQKMNEELDADADWTADRPRIGIGGGLHRGDPYHRGRANHEYRKIAEAISEAQSINSEAQDCNQCAGPINNPNNPRYYQGYNCLNFPLRVFLQLIAG